MKINGNEPILETNLQSGFRDSDAGRSQKRAATSDDRLEVSVSTRQLQDAKRSVGRGERVAQISEAVKAATYNVRAEAVAESVITGSLVRTKA